jgi:hypothetical protein
MLFCEFQAVVCVDGLVLESILRDLGITRESSRILTLELTLPSTIKRIRPEGFGIYLR